MAAGGGESTPFMGVAEVAHVRTSSTDDLSEGREEEGEEEMTMT